MADKNKIKRMEENKMDETGGYSGLNNSGGGIFEIHVKSQLNSHWSDWLEGLEVKLLKNGEMILFGPVVDQAALMVC